MGNATAAAASRSVAALKTIGGAINNYVIGPAGRAAGALKRIGGGVLGFGASIAKLGALGTTVFGINALKSAASFEEQLAIINTIAHRTPDELSAIGDSLQNLAQQTGLAIEDVTKAEYEFLSAGIGLFKDSQGRITDEMRKAGVEQSLVAINAASRLAVGGLSSLDNATKVLGFALNSYNLNTKDIPAETAKRAGLWLYETKVINGQEVQVKRLARTMGEASDVITDQFSKAIEIGVVTADQIASSFATVAASAQNAGIGIDEISAAYATQTVRGLSARRTTVGLNRAILDLTKPGKALAALMERTGKNYAKIADTKGIHVALQEMRTDANRLGVAYNTLFLRQEGYRFALNITQDDLKDAAGNFELYKRVLFEVQEANKKNADGLTQSQSQVAERMDTVAMKVRQLRLAFQILSERIGRPLLKPLRDFLQDLTNVVIHLYDWARANQKVVASLAPIIGAASALIALTAGTQGLLFVLQPIAPLLGTTATNLRGLAVIVGRLTLPLGLLVAAFGAFRYAVEHGVLGFEMFTDQLNAMEDLGRGVVEVFKTIAASIGFVWDAIQDGDDVTKAVSQALDAIGQSVEDLGPAFEATVAFLGQVFVSVGTAIVDGLSKAIPAIVDWFGGVARTIIPQLGYLLGLFVSWAGDVVPQIIDGLGNLGRGLIQWISDVVPVLVGALGDLTKVIIDWASTVVPQVVAGVTSLAAEVAANISAAAPGIVDAFTTWGTAIVRWIVDDAWPAVSRALGEFLDNVLKTLQDTQVVRGATNAAITLVAGFVAGLATLVGAVAQWVLQNADTIVGIFLETAGQIIGGIVDFFSQHGGEIAAAGVDLAGRLLGGLASAIVNDPTILAKAIGALAVSAVVISEAIAVGRAIAFAMWAPKYFIYLAELVVGNALTGISSAVNGTLKGVITAVGTKIAAGIFYASIYAEWALRTVLAAITSLLTKAGVFAAAAAVGAAIGSAMETAQLQAMYAADAIKKFFGKFLATALPQSTAAGTSMGVAIGTAMTVAMGVAALGAVLLVGKNIKDGLDAQQAEIASGVTGLIQVGTRAQLETARDALKKGIDDMNFLGIPITFGDSRQQLEAQLKRTEDALARMPAIDGPEIKPKLGPPAPTATQKAAASLVSDFERNFANGMARAGVNTAPIDWGALFQKDNATQTIDEIRTKFETTFSDLKTAIINGQSDVEAALKGIGDTKFKSDATRIKDLGKLRTEAEKQLAAAKAAGDSTAQLKLIGVIGDIDQQITALKGAKTLVDDSLAQQGAKNVETAAIMQTAADAQESANTAYEQQLKDAQILLTRGLQLTSTVEVDPNDPGKKKLHKGAKGTAPTLTPPMLTDNQIRASVDRFGEIATGATKVLTDAQPAVALAGEGAINGYIAAINSKNAAVAAASKNIGESALHPLQQVNTYPTGFNMGIGTANGLYASIPAVTAAANAVAQAAAGPLVGHSPPRVGPLSTIDEAGANIVTTWADGIKSANEYAFLAAMKIAGTTSGGLNQTSAFLNGPRDIVPIGRGRGGGVPGVDQGVVARQTELLAEIAGATRLGAAASARSASRDPRAGSPLAARGVLQSLKFQSVTRTRGG